MSHVTYFNCPYSILSETNMQNELTLLYISYFLSFTYVTSFRKVINVIDHSSDRVSTVSYHFHL